MPECWICNQRASLKNQIRERVREEAFKKAVDEEKTVSIWKENGAYKIGDESDAGSNRIIEYISKYSKITVTQVH